MWRAAFLLVMGLALLAGCEDTKIEPTPTSTPAANTPTGPLPTRQRGRVTIPAFETDVQYVKMLQEVAIYGGPADTYEVVGRFAAGVTTFVTGVSENGEWWRTLCLNGLIGDCWVSANPSLTQPLTP
ncbi:MAG: hypothetical protein AB1791_04735 [Chloroflexota bacterium]